MKPAQMMSAGPIVEPIAEPEDAAQHVAVPARRQCEERDVEHADEEVGDPEEDRVVAERIRHRQRDEQQRGHRAEDRQAHARPRPG